MKRYIAAALFGLISLNAVAAPDISKYTKVQHANDKDEVYLDADHIRGNEKGYFVDVVVKKAFPDSYKGIPSKEISFTMIFACKGTGKIPSDGRYWVSYYQAYSENNDVIFKKENAGIFPSKEGSAMRRIMDVVCKRAN